VRRADDPVALDVRRRADEAGDWAALAAAARGCRACPERVAHRSQVVVGDAPAGARVLLMGEAPGAVEDEVGRPFVGRSGQLLDRLLAEVGLPRERVAVLNTAKCRPPGNRPPTTVEAGRCRGWTARQLDLLDPAVVVPLGLSATRWFLGPTTLTAVRGRVHEVDGRRVLPTYHPSAALRWGPGGEPEQLLRADLAQAAALVAA
jgi:DNA polymerase